MHAVKKERDVSEAVQQARRKAEQQKIDHYAALVDQALQKKRDQQVDDEALALTEAVLALNPELYTLWNYRKHILSVRAPSLSTEEQRELFGKELEFTVRGIQINPKSYWVWYHRLWVMERMPEPNWGHELGLCTKFLDLDARNFHCWDYRRTVVRKVNRPPAEEFKYTLQKIEQNFSNYSAWHLRSKLLPELQPHLDDPEVLKTEFELVRNAIFTEPADQSAWLYHRWLLGRQAAGSKEHGLANEALLEQELANIRELLEVEPDSKWPLLASALIMHDLRPKYQQEKLELLAKLSAVDPYRSNYYKDLASRFQTESSTSLS